MLWSLLLLFALTLLLPLIPYAVAYVNPDTGGVPNPGADLWRAVREGDVGTTQVQGVDSGVLISEYGERWRQYRMQQLAPWGALVLGAMVGIFIVYYLVRGKIRIEDGRSGKRVRRYTTTEMTVHWILASTFVLLAL